MVIAYAGTLKGIPINGRILKEKLFIPHLKLHDGATFPASDEWLSYWKKHHGVWVA